MSAPARSSSPPPAAQRVIATAKPGAEADLVFDLGAVNTVDSSLDLTTQARAIATDGVHALLHYAGDGAQLADRLATGGRLASTLGFGPRALTPP